jgi:hypothetical protein
MKAAYTTLHRNAPRAVRGVGRKGRNCRTRFRLFRPTSIDSPMNQQSPQPFAGPYAVNRCSTPRRFSALTHSAAADTRPRMRRGSVPPFSPGASRGSGRHAPPAPPGPAQKRGEESAREGPALSGPSLAVCAGGRRYATPPRFSAGPRRAGARRAPPDAVVPSSRSTFRADAGPGERLRMAAGWSRRSGPFRCDRARSIGRTTRTLRRVAL